MATRSTENLMKTKKISKGTIIATSKPFVFALLSEERATRCEQCFHNLTDSINITCADCGFVNYCSIQCRDESVESGFHRIECQTTASRPLRNLTRLIARVLVRLYGTSVILSNHVDNSNQCFMNEDRFNGMVERQQHVSEKYHFVEHIGPYKRDWNCLMDHYDDIIHDPSAMHTFEYVYDELELLFDGSIRNGIEYRKLTQIVSMEMLIRIYGKILVNSFAIQESGDRTKDHGNSLRQIGRGVYLGPSIFDHSCSPDAMFTFDGTRLYLIALRDLYTDDVRQIYISYIDELETFIERQRQLRSAFYFDCACTRCTNQISNEGHSISLFIDDGDENLQLRMLNEKIEDLYANTRFESRYVLLAQHKLHFISSISRLTQPNLHLLSNNLIAIDMKERTMCDNVCQLIDDANIENELIRCNTILAVRVSDFLASYRSNARQMERLVNIYRRYYGDHHPRLLNKIYHFIGLLLVKIAIIIDERRHRLIGNINNLPLNHLANTQLDACLQVLVRLCRQSRSIQTFIDESIDSCPSSLKNGDVYRSIIIGATLIDENSSQKKQIEYSNRTSSYRDLLQQNGQLVEHNRTQTDDSNGGTEDTRKQ